MAVVLLVGVVALAIAGWQTFGWIGWDPWQVSLHRPSTWVREPWWEMVMASRLVLLLSLAVLVGLLVLRHLRRDHAPTAAGGLGYVALALGAVVLGVQRLTLWTDDGDGTCAALYRPGIWRERGGCTEFMVPRGLSVVALLAVAVLAVRFATPRRGAVRRLPSWPGAVAACSVAAVLVGSIVEVRDQDRPVPPPIAEPSADEIAGAQEVATVYAEGLVERYPELEGLTAGAPALYYSERGIGGVSVELILPEPVSVDRLELLSHRDTGPEPHTRRYTVEDQVIFGITALVDPVSETVVQSSIVAISRPTGTSLVVGASYRP